MADGFAYNMQISGAEIKNNFPTYEEASKSFKKFGLSIKPLHFKQIWDAPETLKDYFTMPAREVLRYFKNMLLKQKHDLRYPTVGGYSDVFVVSADTIKLFSHYCGITAVTRLFVEVGLPTSMVLSAKDIVTEKKLSLKGLALWTEEDYTVLEKYNHDLDYLLNNFPAQLLYIHPIKLSKWIL